MDGNPVKVGIQSATSEVELMPIPGHLPNWQEDADSSSLKNATFEQLPFATDAVGY
jgi:hypothetical protein